MDRITLLSLLLLSGCKADLIGVPRESCEYTDTGKTRVNSWMQCMPTGSGSTTNACGMQIWHNDTQRLFDVSCKFQEWK